MQRRSADRGTLWRRGLSWNSATVCNPVEDLQADSDPDIGADPRQHLCERPVYLPVLRAQVCGPRPDAGSHTARIEEWKMELVELDDCLPPVQPPERQ